MQVKHGPVMLLSAIKGAGGGVELLCAKAELVTRPILELGNTNSRYRFSISALAFVEAWNGHGPAHHYGVGSGIWRRRSRSWQYCLGCRFVGRAERDSDERGCVGRPRRYNRGA